VSRVRRGMENDDLNWGCLAHEKAMLPITEQ